MNLDIPPDTLRLKDTNFIELDKFFASAGFNTIREKWRRKSSPEIWLNQEAKSEVFDNISKVEKKYILVDTKEKFDELCRELEQATTISFDLETNSLDRNSCKIVGIALSTKEFTGYYIPVSYEESEQAFAEELFSTQSSKPKWENLLPVSSILQKLKPILENHNIKKCGQNIKFDLYIMKRHGIDISPVAFDSMVASYVLDPDRRHNLNDLSKTWLNYEPIPISQLIGEKKSEQISMNEVDPKIIKDYAAEDADLALRLYSKLDEELAKEKKLYDLAHKIEFPLIEVLTQMEYNGICIDTKALMEISKQIDIESAELQKNI
jgi:DNA polymerase-1